MDERSELIRRLRRGGIDGGTPDGDDERLAAAGIEVALGGPGKHTLSGLAHKSGLNTGIARSVMQALARPNPSRGERLFTDEDVELVRAHKQFVDAGLPRDERRASASRRCASAWPSARPPTRRATGSARRSTSPAASRRRPSRGDRFEWKRRRRRALAGISDRVRLYELQPS
jgi:hypothetical protein